jgi:hypothetical protein
MELKKTADVFNLSGSNESRRAICGGKLKQTEHSLNSMKRGPTGNFVPISTVGEVARAFVPPAKIPIGCTTHIARNVIPLCQAMNRSAALQIGLALLENPIGLTLWVGVHN